MLIPAIEWRPDVLEEHAEELESLWNRRLRAERSALVDAVGLRRVHRRIEAHADALVLAGHHAVPFVERLLASGSAASAAAAAFVVGCSDAAALVERLLGVLPSVKSAARAAIWAALEQRAGRALLAELAKVSAQQEEAQQEELRAGALSVCAARDPGRARSLGLEPLLAASSPIARALAWRAVGRLGASGLPASTYALAFADDEPAVRRAALEAAARTRHGPLLEHLRRAASSADLSRIEDHVLLALLADATDARRLESLVRTPPLGWERYRLLALWGRAPAVTILLEVMQSSDAVESALAGAAFFRITGVSAAGDQRVPLVPAGTPPDDFTDLIHVCDGERAERAWNELRPRMADARWAYGVDTDAVLPEDLPLGVDLESRWAAELRARFGPSAWQGRRAYDL
ncbi:MAG TPA: hypothetical protein VMG12_11185 [Polyangiaceae bacterium]|nr:hypothetical protein [Polyangiaceae bacterium]